MKNSTLATTMKILFKFPSRSRPAKFFATIKNIQDNIAVSDEDNYLISATLDVDDHSMENKQQQFDEIKNFEITWGRSRNKIHAINRDVNMVYPWDILVLCSDDMTFIEHGFDNTIRRDFKLEDSLDRVIHYGDGFNHDPIVSIPVIGKDWYAHYAAIYPPAYISLFADEELYIVAKKLGKLYSSDAKIVRHDHPTWIGGPSDSQLKHTESFHPIDHQTFLKRKRVNFFLK